HPDMGVVDPKRDHAEFPVHFEQVVSWSAADLQHRGVTMVRHTGPVNTLEDLVLRVGLSEEGEGFLAHRPAERRVQYSWRAGKAGFGRRPEVVPVLFVGEPGHLDSNWQIACRPLCSFAGGGTRAVFLATCLALATQSEQA